MHILLMYCFLSLLIYLSPIVTPSGRKIYREAMEVSSQKFLALQFIITGFLFGWFIGLLAWLVLFLRRD